MTYNNLHQIFMDTAQKILAAAGVDQATQQAQGIQTSLDLIFWQTIIKSTTAHSTLIKQQSLLPQMVDVTKGYIESLSADEQKSLSETIAVEETNALNSFFSSLANEIPNDKRAQLTEEIANYSNEIDKKLEVISD